MYDSADRSSQKFSRNISDADSPSLKLAKVHDRESLRIFQHKDLRQVLLRRTFKIIQSD